MDKIEETGSKSGRKKGSDRPNLETQTRQASAALDMVRAAWLNFADVSAVDVGLRRADHAVVVRVHTDNDGEKIGRILPRKLAGFPVEIIQASYGIEKF